MPIDLPEGASAFARWLAGAIGDRPLNQVGQNARVSPSMLSRYVRDLSRPTAQSLKRLGAYFDRDPRELAALLPDPLEAPPDRPAAQLAPVQPAVLAREIVDEMFAEIDRRRFGDGPPLPVASAGSGGPVQVDQVQSLVLRVRGEAGMQRGPLIAFEVTGDCLSPRLRPGWIAWVNPEASPRLGDVVLASVDGEEMFKIYDRGPGESNVHVLHALDGRPDIAVAGPRVEVRGVVQLVQHPP